MYLYNQPAANEVKAFSERAATLRATKPADNMIAVLTEVPGETPVTHLFYRGDVKQPRDENPAGRSDHCRPAGLPLFCSSP